MFDKLETREKYLLIILILAVIGLSILALGKYLLGKRQQMIEKVEETQNQILELDKQIKEYNHYKSIKTGNPESLNNIISKLEQLLQKHSLKDSVSTMRDSTTVTLKKFEKITVDINFNSVQLKNVYNIIYDIEVNKQINAKVEAFTFRRPFAGKEVYDVNLKITTYNKKGGKGGR